MGGSRTIALALGLATSLAVVACAAGDENLGSAESTVPMHADTMHDGDAHDGMMDVADVDMDACRPVDSGRVTIVAAALGFDTDCISVPAGQPFVIELDNRDSVAHNIMIERAGGPGLLDGSYVTDGVIAYPIAGLEAGEYPFHCHVHPTMQGVLVVG